MSNLSYTSKKNGLGDFIGYFSIKIDSYDELIEIKRKINYHRFDLSHKNYFIKPELLTLNKNLLILDIYAYDNESETYEDIAVLEKKISKLIGIQNMLLNI